MQREESLKHLMKKDISINPSDKLKEKFKDEPNRFKRATFDLTYRLNKPGATTRNITPSFMNNYAISLSLLQMSRVVILQEDGVHLNGKKISLTLENIPSVEWQIISVGCLLIMISS